MKIYDRSGRSRVRKITSRVKEGDDGIARSHVRFIEPEDVEGVQFLTIENPDGDDDQWLYMPAGGILNRISGSSRRGSFMGSDFTYADMTDRNLDSYDYELLQETDIDGVAVWVVDAIPNTKKEIDETGYTRQVIFVRKDNHVAVRSKSWLKKGGRNKYFDVKKLELIDGIWTATEMHMTTKKGKKTLHKTILISDNVKYGQDMNEDTFSVRRLEKGL